MRNGRCDFVSLSKSQWFPLWLGYLGAFLESKGFEVTLVDAPAYELNHAQTETQIAEANPDFLVIYTGRLSEDNDVAFADKLVERLGVPAVFVGPYCSIAPERFLEKSSRVDWAVSGEFEYPVWELLSGKAPENIANLHYKKDGAIRSNPKRPYLSGEELDKIPFVSEFFSRHLDFKKYSTPSELNPFVDILAGRGCAWGHCTYCLWVHSFITGCVYNARSAANVAAELKQIAQKMPWVRSVMIQDDTITDQRGKDLAQAFLDVGNTLPWSCYARADLSYETMTLMKKAGCRNLHVGFESAAPEILKTIKKGLTAERMTRFAEDSKRAGLRLHGDFAIGFPGETRETAEATISWACRMRPHTAQFQLMIPFPGTPFHEQLTDKGWIKDGCAHYPETSAEELEGLAKKAYRRYYLSSWFVWQILKHPVELFFTRLPTYLRAVPSIFWKKYVR
jgi:radical SAM superfamily enzyme YgiQ (UPF0313 family)